MESASEGLMRAHAIFCVRRADAFLSLTDDNKALAVQEELERISVASREIDGHSTGGVRLDSRMMQNIGLLAINASAAMGALRIAISDAATERKGEAAP